MLSIQNSLVAVFAALVMTSSRIVLSMLPLSKKLMTVVLSVFVGYVLEMPRGSCSGTVSGSAWCKVGGRSSER